MSLPTNQPSQNENIGNNSNQSFNELFNNLRIPDVIKDLPKYFGDPKTLHEFINNVEEILQVIRGTDGTPYGQILLRAIRNKIEGQANEVLNMYSTPLNWDEIKNNLILHYADKRTETSLIRDLHNLKQNKSSVEEFYNKIISIQSALNNNLLLNEIDNSVIKSKKDLFTEMCLNSFLVGLKEPIGSNIRAMKPDSLASALAYCIKEQNIYYQQTRNEHFTKTPNFRRQYNYNNFQPNPPHYRQVNDNRYLTPYYRQPTTNNQYYKPITPNLNRTSFYKPNNYHNNNYNSTDNINNTRQNPFNQTERAITYPKPEPMDISSGTSKYTTRTNHTTNSNRFSPQKFGQVHNINNEQYAEEDFCNIEETSNFRTCASANLQDT